MREQGEPQPRRAGVLGQSFRGTVLEPLRSPHGLAGPPVDRASPGAEAAGALMACADHTPRPRPLGPPEASPPRNGVPVPSSDESNRQAPTQGVWEFMVYKNGLFYSMILHHDSLHYFYGNFS